MAGKTSEDISGLVLAWSQGDQEALNRLMPVVYPELRRIARRYTSRKVTEGTVGSASLVNEAYLKLIRVRGVRCDSRVHFFALCAQMIRRILVDYARKRRYAKRGGDAVLVPLDEALLGTRARGIEVLALHEALVSLAGFDPRKARAVELRYFGGLTVEETAEVLQISPETVLRDWTMAKAWLFRELKSGKPHNAGDAIS